MTGHRPFSELKHKGDPSNRCPSCGSDKIVMVEYAYGSPERYDGVTERGGQTFRILGILIVIWGGVLLISVALLVHYFIPQRRKKNIEKLEHELFDKEH